MVLVWILCRTPLFWGRRESALIWQVIVIKRLNMGKLENKLSHEVIDLYYGIITLLIQFQDSVVHLLGVQMAYHLCNSSPLECFAKYRQTM